LNNFIIETYYKKIHPYVNAYSGLAEKLFSPAHYVLRRGGLFIDKLNQAFDSRLGDPFSNLKICFCGRLREPFICFTKSF